MKIAYEYLVDKVVGSLLKENNADVEEAEIYRFGVEVTLLKTWHVVSYFGIAACMRKIPEFIIIFGIFCAFRRNTGGFHAKTRMGCYLFSCLMVMASLAVTEGEINLSYMCGLSICELVILWFISPVKNENRPMDEEEIFHFRKRLYIISAIFTAVFIFTANLGYFYLVYLYTIALTLSTVLTVFGKMQEGGAPGEKQEKKS